jgi:uncharacterized protein (TIGR04255 family)
MERLPLRLSRPSLIEATFELRFVPNDAVAAELVPGLLYPSLKDLFPRVEQLQAASVPKEILRGRPELKYVPLYRFHGDSAVLGLGENLLAVSLTPPYSGWRAFRPTCRHAVETLVATGYVKAVDRYSLRFTNLFPLKGKDPLADLNIRLDAGVPFEPSGMKLRFEKLATPYVTVVECSSVVKATIPPSETREGVLFVLDTIRKHDSARFLESIDEHLDKAHTVLESLFFGLVSKAAIEEMGPVWEEK